MITNTDYINKSVAKIVLNMGNGKLMEYSKNSNAWIEVQKIKNKSVVNLNFIEGGGRLFKFISIDQ